MNNIGDNLIDSLKISPFLKSRIHQRVSICTENSNNNNDHAVGSNNTASASTSQSQELSKPFVLYLPTVNLRMDQNPAFALACHLSNHYEVPLVVLAVLLDDRSLPSSSKSTYCNNQNGSRRSDFSKEVTMTARRLAFLTEALSESCQHWSNHGAGVAIRVHKPKGRIPDHLTLSSRSTAVVVDEPFVHPFLSFVLKVEQVCKNHSVPCFRVDGSTTVPPLSVLQKVKRNKDSGKETTRETAVDVDNMIYFTGLPAKAWMWQKKTESLRKNQIQAAMNGDFDAPKLDCRIDDDAFFLLLGTQSNCLKDQERKLCDSKNETLLVPSREEKQGNQLISPFTFPVHWRNRDNEAPGLRPWTVNELVNLTSIKDWALSWPGSDSAVEPCTQTLGTSKAGIQRWNHWVSHRKGMVYYAKKRTDPLQPHASSRMSCYLNFGIVSIYRIVNEVKIAQQAKVSGADKFEEEIIKWREMSYAHCFSRSDYNTIAVVPQWAKRWLNETKTQKQTNLSVARIVHSLHCLENCNSGDAIWDAMQEYLMTTGELHNNVRMTWGKILVHWEHSSDSLGDQSPTSNLLHVLCYLNDRYALDGLSPPSYAGLLWCIGWSDKPDRKGGISTKRRYKLPVVGFQQAKDKLMNDSESHLVMTQMNIMASLESVVSKRNICELDKEQHDSDSPLSQSVKKRKAKQSGGRTLHEFFNQK